MHQIRFPLGLRPRPRWVAFLQIPVAGLRGPTSKEKGGGKGGEESWYPHFLDESYAPANNTNIQLENGC